MNETTAPSDVGQRGPLEVANASALIFNSAGEYLLHLRDDVAGIWEPGSWALLGGGREPADASLESTVRRELMEEAGLDLPVLEPFAVETATGTDGSAIPIQIFAAHWDGDATSLRLTEGVMLAWFRPEVMPRLRLSPSTLDLVQRHTESHAAHCPGAASTTAAIPLRRSPSPRSLPPSPASGKHAFTVIGVHLYLENTEGQVLLGLRHPDSAYAGELWHFLAGHCEQGESAVAGLVREAEEEAGLLIRPQDIEFVHAVHLVDEPGTQPRLQLVFRAWEWAGQTDLREPDKCLAWHWWDPTHLPDQIVPYTRTAIDGIREGRLYTELGWS
ncbi:NUDIX domain-containing protein [Streptomyces sp. NPDC050636]|uniref:NUDIX hydrolase n=1 Tax=Streptomyces sp. NPDC050636 TaxID=3154510 RepID=UPI0034136F42